jgi:hypothetical protein
MDDPTRNLTRSARRVLSSQQFKRFEKIYIEPFYVVSSTLDDNMLAEFAVSGSTQNVYSVKLGRNGRFKCSCPDSYTNCARLQCICKHACFVIFRVFRLAHVLDVGDLRLSEQDIDAIVSRVAADDFDKLQLAPKKSTKILADFETILRPPAVDDECPVCYSFLFEEAAEATKNTKSTLVGCPDCGNSIHRECARRWMMHASVPTCVYCRSRVWKEFLKS